MTRVRASGAPPLWLFALATGLAVAAASAASAEEVIFASPVFDRNDRIELILNWAQNLQATSH